MKFVSNVVGNILLVLWTMFCFYGFYQVTYGQLKEVDDVELSLLFLIFGLAQSVCIGINVYNIIKEDF